MSDNDNSIPTLDEVIFHGRVPPPNDTSPVPGKPATQPHDAGDLPASPVSEASSAAPAKPSFEQTLQAMIDDILQKHLQAAREEISRAVIAELKSRVPANLRNKSHN